MDKKWLRQQLDERGRGTQAALAQYLGLSPSVTNKLINGSRRILADEADRIRAFLDGDSEGQQGLALGTPLLAGSQLAGSQLAGSQLGIRRGPLAKPGAAPLAAHPARLADIPVWASAAAGDEDGSAILTDSPIDFIQRSETMQGVANPFAFYVVGDSMLERFAPGDQVVVNPSLPLSAGNDCVFIRRDEDGTLHGLVKRLLRAAADHWRVRQFNPRRDFDLSRKKWTLAYRIAETRYRG